MPLNKYYQMSNRWPMIQYSVGVEPGSVPGGGAVPGVLLQDSVPGRSGWKHGAHSFEDDGGS